MHWEYFVYGIKKWWDQSKIRNWAIANPDTVFKLTGVSLILLVLTIIYVLIPSKQPNMYEPELAWFYDMNTGKLFKAEARLLPPIDSPSGADPNGKQAGVKAFVYKYMGDPNAQPFVAFLQTTAPGKKQEIAAILESEKESSQNSANKVQHMLMVKRVADKKWFAADSTEGLYIMATQVAKNGRRAVYYPPKSSRNDSSD
jgi:hypothetical protein